MDKRRYYLANMVEALRAHPVKDMSLYVAGIGGAVIPRAQDSYFRYIQPESIKVESGTAPILDKEAEDIVEARVPASRLAVNNPVPCLERVIFAQSGASLRLYMADFRHWRGTLPQADGYDSRLKREFAMFPFNTAAIAITKDGYFVAPQRTNSRSSHQGDYCLLNGFRKDRDVRENTIEGLSEILADGTGQGIMVQSNGAIATQLNIPVEKITRNELMGLVVSEPAVSDCGYHSAHIAWIDMDSKEVVERANEIYGNIKPSDKGRYIRIERDKHVVQFTKERLAEFSRFSLDNMAVTQQPLLWLAGAIEFGDKWLEKVPFVSRNLK